MTKLKACEEEFNNWHFRIIDSIAEDDDEALEREQEVLDNFVDTVSSLAVRLEDLISFSATSAAPPATMDRRPHTRKMTRVETGLDRVATYLDGTPDRIELNQCQEELSDYTRETWLLCMKTSLRGTSLMMMNNFANTPSLKGNCQVCHRS